MRLLLVCCLLARLASADASPPAAAEDLGRWREIDPYLAGSGEAHCANWSSREFHVAVDGGRIRVTAPPTPTPVDRQPNCSSFGGTVHRRRVDGGWLLAQDSGEWGGAVCFVGDGGDRHVLDARLPAIGFAEWNGGLVAVTGLWHMGLRDGALLRLERDGGGRGTWRARPLLTLPDAPIAFAVAPDGALLFATTEAVWRLPPGGKPALIHRGRWDGLYPGSIAIAGDGAIYLGMRHAVAHLTREGDHLREHWLVPPDCGGACKGCRCDRGAWACGR